MKKKVKRRRHKKCKIDATHETNKKEEQVHSIFNKQKSEQMHVIEYRLIKLISPVSSNLLFYINGAKIFIRLIGKCYLSS